MNDDQQPVRRELGVHGRRWNSLHGGYFADAEVARPLVEAAAAAMAEGRPSVVADLGGLLAARCPRPDVRLVNVDVSDRQMAECPDGRIVMLRMSAHEVTREALGVGEGRLLVIMRSVLHYVGRDGLGPLLRRLRSLVRPGEMFVHQTACFQKEREAECLNLLYDRMRTDKWYPTVEALRAELSEAGWEVREVQPAPALPLEAADLAERYGLARDEVAALGTELEHQCGRIPEVFLPRPEGFMAYLHYHIFTCRAV
jgi:hypothetical protein